MNTLSTAWIVARKDLRLYFRDRTGMALGFLLPVVLITVFGFVMKYAFRGEGMVKATLWVADQDDGRRSRQLIEELSNSETVRVKRPAEPAADDAAMRSMITDGEAHHVLIIRQGFGEAIAAGELPKLIMLRDPGRKQDDRLIQIGLIQAFMAVSEGKLWPAAMANPRAHASQFARSWAWMACPLWMSGRSILAATMGKAAELRRYCRSSLIPSNRAIRRK